MSNLEDYVIEYLENFSVVAEKIPESNEKTPDFLIEQEETVLIELKEKSDSEDKHKEQKEVLDNNSVYEHITTTGHNNRISGVITGGMKQLENKKSKHDCDFCLLFFVANGVAPGSQAEQIQATLYGKKNVIDFDSQSSVSISCYYAYFSDFFRYKKTLDGAFLASKGRVILLLNDQSPNFQKLKDSSFIKKFQGKISIIDPVELERDNQIYIADFDADRKDEALITSLVFNKYKIKKGLLIDFPNYTHQVQM
jgi:hypothetical protein